MPEMTTPAHMHHTCTPHKDTTHTPCSLIPTPCVPLAYLAHGCVSLGPVVTPVPADRVKGAKQQRLSDARRAEQFLTHVREKFSPTREDFRRLIVCINDAKRSTSDADLCVVWGGCVCGGEVVGCRLGTCPLTLLNSGVVPM